MGYFRKLDPAGLWARIPRFDPRSQAPGDQGLRAPAARRENGRACQRGRQVHRGGKAMKFYMIHLMPFADLDLTYDKHHNSAWVTLPNSYYDPQKGAKLYNRYIDELVLADELGFDGVCCNEHHQNAYGLMPIPGVIAGALVRETKRCHVAVLGRALPLLTYPLSVAEEYAMLDNISNGRLIAGFVRGIGAEY